MRPYARAAETTRRARALRQGDNSAEGALWNVLKARQLGGHKFIRQHPIGPYFADFVQRSAKLVIKVDGSQHVENSYDRIRDEYMRNRGYSVLRFWSHDVLHNRPAVCDTILAVLNSAPISDVVASVIRFVAGRPSPA